MADIRTCKYCGRRYDNSTARVQGSSGIYCSTKCAVAAGAPGTGKGWGPIGHGGALNAESWASVGRGLKYIGIALAALVSACVLVFYKFPKSLKQKSIKLFYAYIIMWAVIIIGVVIYNLFSS